MIAVLLLIACIDSFLKRCCMYAEMLAYNGNLKWLQDRTIIFVRAGSHAYGTNVPESDEDYKGVAIPPAAYHFGYLQRFEQAEFGRGSNKEGVIYDIKKFFKLAADANPNILEVLWADPADYLHVSKAGQKIIDHRDMFLSRRVAYTFVGYARSQLKRIKTHRRWLLEPPLHEPTRAEFDLPERPLISRVNTDAALSQVRGVMDRLEMDLGFISPADRKAVLSMWSEILAQLDLTKDERWKQCARYLGFEDNFMLAVEREKNYRQARNNWSQYQEWKVRRNPTRAALEAVYGFDCKHGAHLVRLMRMGKEILETGQVIVKRPDAAELLAIRNGAWLYDELVDWAGQIEDEINELAKISVLPKQPDRNALDVLCVEIVAESLGILP